MDRSLTDDPNSQSDEMQDRASLVRDALSHSIRVRILGWMRHQPARTRSEVAAALAISDAAARYHLKVLEGADVVTSRGTRPGPDGVAEEVYAYNPQVWPRISDDPDRAEKCEFMLDYTFASIHEIHRKAVDMIKEDWSPAFLAGSVGTYATPDEIRAFRDELGSLVEGFSRRHKDDHETAGAVPVAITFAVVPSSTKDARGWAGERVFEWSGVA